MSVTIALLPLALAAASAAIGGGMMTAATVVGGTDAAPSTLQVHTRMKDLGLLDRALRDIDATEVDTASGERVTAVVDGVTLALTRDDEGIWQARLSGGGLDDDALRRRGMDLLARLDTAYAARVQEAVADRIRARADAAGMDLTSETRHDDTVTMVLTVRDGH